jgi:phage gp45-like
MNIVLTENGILVNANGKDVEVNNSTNVTINASKSILANTPLFQCTGDIVDNCNTNSSTLKALREAYNDHDHDVDKVQGGEDKVTSEKTKGQVDG